MISIAKKTASSFWVDGPPLSRGVRGILEKANDEVVFLSLRQIFLITLFVLGATFATGQTVLKIKSGTTLAIAGTAPVTLKDVALDNDGVITTVAGGNLLVNGALDTDFDGIGASSFGELKLEKSGGAKMILKKDISINESLALASGLLDLNGNTIFLSPAATVDGESETSRIIGSDGSIEITLGLDAPSGVDPGNLGLVFLSSDDLGSTRIVRGHAQQSAAGIPGSKSLLRYYDVFPDNNSGLSVDLIFHYFDVELDGIPESELELWQSDDAGANWILQGFASASAASNEIRMNGISTLSRFTLASATTAPLPVNLLYFDARCDGALLLVEWATGSEAHNAAFLLEHSNDGESWSALASFEGAGNSSSPREYQWAGQADHSGYFRLRQTDFDGRPEIVSPIAYAACGLHHDWRAFPNPMKHSGVVFLSLQEEQMVTLELWDVFGQKIQTLFQETATGNRKIEWQAGNLPPGAYYLTLRLRGYRDVIPVVILR